MNLFERRYNILILVDAHEVEPVLLLCSRLIELDLAISKCPEQAFISNIAHAIQG